MIRARVGHKLKISTLVRREGGECGVTRFVYLNHSLVGCAQTHQVGHRDLVKFHQGYSFVLKDCLDNLEHAKHKKGARRLRA